MVAGAAHSLALTSEGQLWAFGDNSAGQLGTGGKQHPRQPPAQVEATVHWVALAAGRAHSLGIAKDGQVHAWGQVYAPHYYYRTEFSIYVCREYFSVNADCRVVAEPNQDSAATRSRLLIHHLVDVRGWSASWASASPPPAAAPRSSSR